MTDTQLECVSAVDVALAPYKLEARRNGDWCSICHQLILGRIQGTLVRCQHNNNGTFDPTHGGIRQKPEIRP